MFAIPVTLVTSAVYCVVAAYVFTRFQKVRWLALVGSLAVGAFVLTEVLLVVTLGAKEAYSRFGIGFWGIHAVSFVFGPPAFANVLLFENSKSALWRKIQVGLVSLVCWVSCMGSILADILLDESIFGR
jgi:hypothetical protein